MYRQRFRRLMIRNSGLHRRRLWVAVMYAGLCGWTIPSLVMGLPSLSGTIPRWTLFTVFFSFAVLGALGFFITSYTSTHVTHGLKEDPPSEDGKLDERQSAVWHRASHKAYFVVLGLLLIVTGYWLFVWPLLRLPETEVMPLLALAIFLLAFSLPNAIVAWTEPDQQNHV